MLMGFQPHTEVCNPQVRPIGKPLAEGACAPTCPQAQIRPLKRMCCAKELSKNMRSENMQVIKQNGKSPATSTHLHTFTYTLGFFSRLYDLRGREDRRAQISVGLGSTEHFQIQCSQSPILNNVTVLPLP